MWLKQNTQFVEKGDQEKREKRKKKKEKEHQTINLKAKAINLVPLKASTFPKVLPPFVLVTIKAQYGFKGL